MRLKPKQVLFFTLEEDIPQLTLPKKATEEGNNYYFTLSHIIPNSSFLEQFSPIFWQCSGAIPDSAQDWFLTMLREAYEAPGLLS